MFRTADGVLGQHFGTTEMYNMFLSWPSLAGQRLVVCHFPGRFAFSYLDIAMEKAPR